MKKVNSLIQKIVGEIVQTEITSDKVHAFFYTVTKVTTSADLHYASVYISVLGDQDKAHEGFAILCKQRKIIQRIFATKIRLKFTPKLHLEFDDSALYASRIENIINKIHENDQ